MKCFSKLNSIIIIRPQEHNKYQISLLDIPYIVSLMILANLSAYHNIHTENKIVRL